MFVPDDPLGNARSDAAGPAGIQAQVAARVRTDGGRRRVTNPRDDIRRLNRAERNAVSTMCARVIVEFIR